MAKKKWNNKKILLFSLLLLILVALIIVIIVNSFKEKEQLPVYELETLQEILEHYQCELIKKENAKEENIKFNIYVKFDRDYYTEEKSNKGYFTSLVSYLSENLAYENYRLIDTTRNINIAVLCNKKQKSITVIYYNGDRSYFEKKDNEQNIKQYEPIALLDFTIDSNELKKVIQNNWQSGKVNFGTQESTFEEYAIFFEEGMQVKTTASTIYHIVFTEKYKKEIVNGLKVNDTKEKIEKVLGKPTFENNSVIGYKGKQCYVFFSRNEVSVYRTENNYQNEKFVNMLEEFMTNRKQVTLFNTLTDIWKDYDFYTTENGKVVIRYTIKGVEFSFNAIGGKITFYQNFGGQLAKDITLQNLNKENLPEYAALELTTDLVWEAEKQRKNIRQDYYNEEFMEATYQEYYLDEELDEQKLEELSQIEYKTKNFYVFSEKMNSQSSYLKFISINRQYPDSELKFSGQVKDFTWLDDNNLIYSISRKRNLPI